MTFLPDPLLRHLRDHLLLKMVLATFLIYWICMLPALLGSAATSQASVRLLMVPAMVTMYWLATSLSSELARALEVLGQLQAPHHFQRQLSAGKLQAIAFAWAFLAAGASMQLALPRAHAAPASGAALVSLMACLALLRVLSRHRLVLAPLAGPLSATPYGLCMAFLVLDVNRLIEWFGALPMALHAACTLAFPLLLLALRRRWSPALPAYRWRPKEPTLGSWLQNHARRFTILMWKKPLIGDPATAGGHWAIVNLVSAGAFPFFFLLNRPVWEDGTIHLPRLLASLMSIAVIAGMLVVRDLHWRAMLTPGGLKRGRMGFHIWRSSVSLQLCILAVGTTLTAGFVHFHLGIPAEAIGRHLTRHWTLLLEVPLLASAALVLRAAAFGEKWMGIVVVAMALGVGLATLPFLSGNGLRQVPLWLYLLASVLATGALLALANRLWTVKRLFDVVARSQAD